MIEDARPPGRIDLRAIDQPADPARMDRVVRGALARVAPGEVATGRTTDRGRALPYFAAAGLLLLASGLLLLSPGRRPPNEPASLVADWTVSSHVPTNAELLAAFRGYRR